MSFLRVRMMAQRQIKLLDYLTSHDVVGLLLRYWSQKATGYRQRVALRRNQLLPAVTLLAKVGGPDDGPQCTSRITAIPLSAASKPVSDILGNEN